MMLSPDDPRAPKYWMRETDGKLSAAVERFLLRKYLDHSDVMLMRAYLRQWIDSPVWDANPHITDEGRRDLAELRRQARNIQSVIDIEHWLREALQLDIDPL